MPRGGIDGCHPPILPGPSRAPGGAGSVALLDPADVGLEVSQATPERALRIPAARPGAATSASSASSPSSASLRGPTVGVGVSAPTWAALPRSLLREASDGIRSETPSSTLVRVLFSSAFAAFQSTSTSSGVRAVAPAKTWDGGGPSSRRAPPRHRRCRTDRRDRARRSRRGRAPATEDRRVPRADPHGFPPRSRRPVRRSPRRGRARAARGRSPASTRSGRARAASS